MGKEGGGSRGWELRSRKRRLREEEEKGAERNGKMEGRKTKKMIVSRKN